MTTADQVITSDTIPGPAPDAAPETAPEVRRRRRLWPRLLIGFFVGFLLCVGIAGGALLAFDANHEGRVLAGVRVGDVDLSGLDRAGAVAALQAAYGSYGDGQVVIRTSAGDVTVPYAAFSRRPDVDAMADEALQTGRGGTVLERAVAEVRLLTGGLSLQPRMLLDPDAFAVRARAAVAPLGLTAVDARVVVTPTSIDTVPGRSGRAFDASAAVAAALPIIGRTDAPNEVVVEAPVTVTPPVHGDGEAAVAKTAAERMVRDITVALGKKHWKIKAATVRTWIQMETGADGTTWPTVDETAVTRSLTKIAKGVKVAPVSATYLKTRGGRIVGVVASKDGRVLDAVGTASGVSAELAARAVGGKPAAVKVQTVTVGPKLTTADALKHAPLMTMLGSWKTWFPISDHNFFGANIWTPARIIDGTVLSPGERFEWWSRVGPVTPARGFGPGGFIAGDHTEPTGALGGGMCSSSTTLFNAALRAGLQMGSRSNHKYYIYRYPLGLDATVSKTAGGGSQTMSFTNDMKTPIVIRTYRYRAGGKGWVRYEIWGIPDGRKVSLSKPSVWNVRRAVTSTQYVSSLPHGVRMQTEFPANGMDVSVTRVVRKGGKVIHSDTYRTHYVLWNGIIQVGR